MKRILLASVAALGLAGTASAADLAVKAPVVYAPVFTWTGCYLGINGGWIGGKDEFTSHADPYYYDAYTAAITTNSYGPNDSAGTAGGQFGCQAQLGSWVIGAEWDWNWSGLKEENAWNWFDAGYTQLTTKEVDWFSTARVRLGLAWDRVLVYATGGFAMANYTANTSILDGNGFPIHYGAYDEKRLGYAVGGGIEWAFANNWTAKAEFLYLDFGSFDYTSSVRSASGTTAAAFVYPAWDTNVDAKEYVARIGLNYLFHVGGAPVVAKY